MPVITLYGLAVEAVEATTRALLEELRHAFPDHLEDIVLTTTMSDAVLLNGETRPYATISSSRETPLVLLRRIATVIVPHLDVEVYLPMGGKDFYWQGSTIPEPGATASDVRWNLKDLGLFVYTSAQKGYASGRKDIEIREPDGSTSIIIEEGPWRSHDNWDGGEPYCGRTRVTYNGKAVWSMVYYGKICANNVGCGSVYGILTRALARMPSEAPYRGPRRYTEASWVYANDWHGDIDDFSGDERIYFGNQVYAGSYYGGLVNVREEDV